MYASVSVSAPPLTPLPQTALLLARPPHPPQLTELHCAGDELDDDGAARLAALTGLRVLSLAECCDVSGGALAVRGRGGHI